MRQCDGMGLRPKPAHTDLLPLHHAQRDLGPASSSVLIAPACARTYSASSTASDGQP
jgi:hypothetical protein